MGTLKDDVELEREVNKAGLAYGNTTVEMMAGGTREELMEGGSK